MTTNFRRSAVFNRAIRRLLRLDVPVQPQTDAETQAEIERNYRWNVGVNLGDVTFFWLGMSFISATTILPLFVSKITDNPFPLALIAIIGQASWFLPQLFTANWIEGLARKKPVAVNLGLILERLPLWLLIPAALMAIWSPILALVLFFIGYATSGFGAGIIAPAWQDLLARCFPVDRRGRFFGTAMFLGGATAALGATLSTWVLGANDFPNNFALLFLIGAGTILFSWFFMVRIREPTFTRTETPRSNRLFWANLPNILRHDHNFRRFIIARMLLALGQMGLGFVTVAAVNRWEIPDAMAGYFTAAYLIGQTIGNLTFGFLADRYGHKLSLELSGLASFLAFGLAWLAASPQWYLAVFMLLGIATGAVLVSGILILLEFCPAERRPTYAGLGNTAVGVTNIIAPLIGAALVAHSYGSLFAVSATVSLVAIGTMHWWVIEPRKTTPQIFDMQREIG